jgi:hypothetical protein
MRTARTEQTNAQRAGSTLVVVIGLLGLLMLLGFAIFSFANMESDNAVFFTESAKQPVDDFIKQPAKKKLFDWALEQIILGAPGSAPLSALTGGDKGLVPIMFGRDLHPFSGPGHDTLPTSINHSAAANGGSPLSMAGQPEPDVGYTSPGINNQFLAFNGYGLDTANRPVLIVKPSYHRPEILRGLDTSAGFATSPATAQAVLRAHADHVVGGKKRFIRTQADANALGLRGPFPFPYANRVQGVWRLRTWAPNTAYSVGDFVEPQTRDGYFYECRTAGTSPAGAEPTWPTINNNEVTSSSGIVWRRKAQPRYEYDADPDRDGIKEAVWLDLDFPAQQITSNKWVVPMFAITIYDADGLLNLNAHGNLAGDLTLNQSTVPFGGESGGQVQPIHRSNLGLLPSEVNPLYALAMRGNEELHPPGDVININGDDIYYADHVKQFGRAPASSMELANMAWFFANEGRIEVVSNNFADGFSGRNGELNRLLAAYDTASSTWSNDFALFPQPGNPGIDDDSNSSWAVRPGGGGRMVHPLDYRGSGQSLEPDGKKRKFTSYGLNQWLSYDGFSQGPGEAPSWNDASLLPGGGTTDLMNRINNELNPLLDDPREVELDLGEDASDTHDDARFRAREAAYLHYTKSGRLKSLLKYTMGTRPYSDPLSNSALHKAMRKQFTPTSFDLRTVGHTRYEPAADPKFRPWEFDADGHFPPHFEVASEPFRPALQNWLNVEHGDHFGSPQQYVQRLFSINQVLDDTSNPGGTPTLRNLTDHHGDPGQDELPITGVQADYSAAQWQEFRARRDRQWMARDLYVMLYTFCGGKNTPYTASNEITGNDTSRDADVNNDKLRNLYTDVQLREMAQFAVNVVDALDRDHVITKFEYDKDLNNGWDLDDNPYDVAEVTTDRAVVFGREAQQLTISETLFISAKKIGDADNMDMPFNHPATEYNDEKTRDFSYVELRNASRFPVNFQDGTWQLVIESVDPDPMTAPLKRRYLTIGTLSKPNKQVAAGGLFTIGTAGDADDVDTNDDPRPSRMRVKYETKPGDPTTLEDNFHRIAPYNSLDLDLIPDGDQNGFTLADENTVKIDGNPPTLRGDFLKLKNPDTAGVSGGEVKVRVILRRRVHPTRETPGRGVGDKKPIAAQSRDNPWVEVDRFTVPLRVFKIEKPKATEAPNIGIKTQLDILKSKERAQPLAPSDERIYTRPGIDKYEHNTLGNQNGASTTGFTLWESHFDRDFTTAAELLSLPLYGPEALYFAPDPNDSAKRIQRRIDRGHGLNRSGEWLAGVRKILHPRDYDGYGPDRRPGDVDFDDDANGTIDDASEWGTLGTDDRKLGTDSVGDAKYDNRWHRLFGLAGVPSRAAGMNRYRVTGRINVNTLRHPAVFAGLLDDRAAFPLGGFNPLRPGSKQTSYLSDTSEGTSRDWWVQLIKSRDGLDGPTQLYIPGMSTSRPFRGFDFVANKADSINDTLLRELPYDAGQNPHPDESRRHLFELGTRAERYGNNQVDHHTRHRLLSKILSNTTTRSNVFFVFVEIGFFEAANDGGVFRLGAKSRDIRTIRGFFVVDRSKAFGELNSNDFNAASTFSIKADNPTTPADEGFSFRNLILYETY